MALQRHSGAALNLQSRIEGADCVEETRQLMLMGCCLTPALLLWYPPAGREVIPSITERHEVSRSFHDVQLMSFFFFFFPVIGNGLRTSSGRIMNNSPRSEKQMSNYVVLMVFTQPDNAAAVILSNLQPSHPKGEKKVPLRSWQGLNH